MYVEQIELSYMAGGNANGIATCKKIGRFLINIHFSYEHTLILWSSNPSSTYLPHRKENLSFPPPQSCTC